MENISAWENGSPEETKLDANSLHTKQGEFSLSFANTVDHSKGEKNYPIGWPRTGKNLHKLGLTDWSDYENLECWIFTTTSRESLPKLPLSIGFYHSGAKHSSFFPLTNILKDEWAKVTIPISKIDLPADIQRIQFTISESNYAHGDQVKGHSK